MAINIRATDLHKRAEMSCNHKHKGTHYSNLIGQQSVRTNHLSLFMSKLL